MTYETRIAALRILMIQCSRRAAYLRDDEDPWSSDLAAICEDIATTLRTLLGDYEEPEDA